MLLEVVADPGIWLVLGSKPYLFPELGHVLRLAITITSNTAGCDIDISMIVDISTGPTRQVLNYKLLL